MWSQNKVLSVPKQKCCGADFQSAFFNARFKIKIKNQRNLPNTNFPLNPLLLLFFIIRDIYTFTVSSQEKKKTENIKLSGQNQSASFHQTQKFQAVRSIVKPFSSCHRTGNSYSPEFFLFKVPAVTKYTKNYLAASPSSSITV